MLGLMPFQIYAELQYEVVHRSTMLLSLHALSTPNQTLTNESFTLTAGAESEFFRSRRARIATCGSIRET